ncbi:MAG: SPW repeat protein [Steroidobacteraceae bacterium]
MDMKRLRDWVIGGLGFWLMLSPRVLHFSPGHLDAVWNTWLVGVAIILVVAVSRYLVDMRSPWEDITTAALGLWLMVSPWVLGFAAHVTERSNSIITGFLVAVLALWAMVVDTDLRKWMDDWMHQHHLLR